MHCYSKPFSTKIQNTFSKNNEQEHLKEKYKKAKA